jgi:7-cyano-7-deazaguanine synthase
MVSGGLDSATCLAIALDEGLDVVALSFDYGQRHHVELSACERILAHYGVRDHLVLDIGLFRRLGGNALTGEVEVPRHDAASDISSDIPPTYVPARNLVFLSYALGVAERYAANQIFIGVNALDYSGYPDCRPEFVTAFEATANLATRAVPNAVPLRIRAPLFSMTKAEIIRWGTRLGVPYALTHSCYGPLADNRSCGRCDSCLLRRKGFHEAGLVDPIAYADAA